MIYLLSEADAESKRVRQEKKRRKNNATFCPFTAEKGNFIRINFNGLL